MTQPSTHLFSPLTLRGVTLPNRIVISPMQQYSAGPDGLPNEFHRQHYGRLSLGGPGLLFTEALALTAAGRVTNSDLGIWSNDHLPALAALVAEIERFGAIPATQLIHAGRKGSVSRPWEGYSPLDAATAAKGNAPWTTFSASAIPANRGWHVPEALDADGIKRLLDDYASAAARAAQAGFRVLNIHAAHGYLIHSFLSPLANHRSDNWVMVRLSCVDDEPGGWTLDDSVALASLLKEAGADVVDCSSGGLGERTTTKMVRRPEGYQVPYAERIRTEASVPTMAVGLITTPAFADAVVRGGRADLVAIGREALNNPHWPLHAARALGRDERFERWPPSWGWWLEKRARAAALAETSTNATGG